MIHHHYRVLLFVAAMLWTCVGHAEAASCKCSDKEDVENRIKEAEAAIKEYQKQRELWMAREAFSKQREMFTWERYGVKGADGSYKQVQWVGGLSEAPLQEQVQNAINRVSNVKAGKATAETNAVTCSIRWVKAPSACLEESMRRHEGAHVSYCKARKSGPFDLPVLTGDYREGIRMVELIDDEITAYMAELDYLKKELPVVQASCRQPRRAYTSRIPRPGVREAPPRWNNI